MGVLVLDDNSQRYAGGSAPGRRRRAFATREQERHAADLLDQQLWCWARDVSRPAGNVLLGLGMCHYRPPTPSGSPSYSGRLPEGGGVTLWGFGVFLGVPGIGGVFLRRFSFAPLYTPREEVGVAGDVDELPPLAAPSSGREWAAVRLLLETLASWVARYEHWIAETCGVAYRRTSLAQRGKRPSVPAEKMAQEWERLGRRCRRLREHGTGLGVWARVLAEAQARASLGDETAAPPRPAAGGRRRA